jgi:hypothetical protein
MRIHADRGGAICDGVYHDDIRTDFSRCAL